MAARFHTYYELLYMLVLLLERLLLSLEFEAHILVHYSVFVSHLLCCGVGRLKKD